MSTNPVAANLREVARRLDEEENRYGGDRVHPSSPKYRQAADEIDRLQALIQEKPVQVTLYGGPVHGATPKLKTQPARIEIAGRYVYVRVDDPDTGESLDFYAYIEEN